MRVKTAIRLLGATMAVSIICGANTDEAFPDEATENKAVLGVQTTTDLDLDGMISPSTGGKRDDAVTTSDEVNSEQTFLIELEKNIFWNITKNIERFWSISIFPLFFICNILSFFVMNLKHNRNRSTCIYMSAIAVNDNLVLLFGMYLWGMNEFSLHPPVSAGCKFNVYALHVLWTFSSYAIVCMTLDKMLAITLPHKAPVYCTAKRARITLVIAFVLVAAFFVPAALFTGIEKAQTNCVRYGIQGWYVTMYVYLSMIVNPVVPFVSIVVMNSIILGTIVKRKTSGLGQQSVAHKVQSQLTVMLLLISTAYLVLTFPFEFREIYVYYNGQGETPKDVAVSSFVFGITIELMFLNNGINFFLYLMSGKKFRDDLKMLL